MAQDRKETKQILIQTTSELMDEFSVEEISAAMVLERAGASKSSMYHFFEDFGDLLEATFLVRFAASVQASDRAIKEIIETSTNKVEFFKVLEKVTQATQTRNNSAIRFQRARMLARSERNERFRKSLGDIQQQLTDSLTQAIKNAQNKGFVTTDFQPRTLAVFIQAYTLGKIVDDITADPMDDQDWDRFITRIASRVFAAE
jgi:AcrR family transcriptional regulator